MVDYVPVRLATPGGTHLCISEDKFYVVLLLLVFHLWILLWIFMFLSLFRYWLRAILLSFVVSVMCCLCTGGMNLHLCFLPFMLLITLYSISMLVVRKLYQKKDEIRRRAHYLRDFFCFLTSISWIVWLASYLLEY